MACLIGAGLIGLDAAVPHALACAADPENWVAWGCHMLLASIRKVLGLTKRHSNAVCLCKVHKGHGVFRLPK